MLESHLRFTATTWAKKRDEFTLFDGKLNVFKHRVVTKALGEVFRIYITHYSVPWLKRLANQVSKKINRKYVITRADVKWPLV